MINLVNQVLETTAELPLLIGNAREAFVGYVYRMSFQECLVITNDRWKSDVNGIPHNSFLVAAGFNPEQMAGAHIIDQEVVLLRVLEPSPLPQETDFVKTILEKHQRRTDIMPGDASDGLDGITAAELQFGGLKCRVLGTFYMKDGHLRMGSDVENFMSLSRLRVYKPRGNSLQKIVNHINPEVRNKSIEEAKKSGFSKPPAPIRIGTVRYTSSDRLHRGGSEPQVTVEIHPSDFLARRTAVFGMTRTGKSNMVKTTVSAVALAALEGTVTIGQLIFDVNGEYANANHQDGNSSIADVFPSDTVRYRAMTTPGFEDLRINFYQEVDQSLNLIQMLHKEVKSSFGGQDLEIFMGSSLDQPDPTDRSATNRWKTLKASYQCLLFKSGYTPTQGLRIDVPASANLTEQIRAWAQVSGTQINMPIPAQGGFASLTPLEAISWMLVIRSANLDIKDSQANGQKIGLQSSTAGRSLIDGTQEAFLNILAQETSKRSPFGGYRVLMGYKEYHSANRVGDVVDEILRHLDKGRIVILDLSVGPVEIRSVLSERIATRLFHTQMGKMNRGEVPNNIVLYVEEAHNLIGKKSELDHIWPRIAKEGAKAKISFVYATQEPSSVHPNILANTENWFVTHLNNDDELRTLAKFYDFGDFSNSLKSAQDVGFARVKTLSSPFVIPTQISKFEPDAIKAKIATFKK